MPRKTRRRARPARRRDKTPPAPTARSAPPRAGGGIDRLRAAAFTVSLLLLSAYLPLSGMIYTESWYRLHCDWYERCLLLGDLAERSIVNLTGFFLHREPLHGSWSVKESQHLTEVRGIYDALAGVALLALAGLAFGLRSARPRGAALVNIAAILSLLLVLPVFGFFWKHVFHELLFSNELWRTDRNDITWYLTPRVMFRNAVIVLVGGGVAINLCVLGVHALLRGRRARAAQVTKR